MRGIEQANLKDKENGMNYIYNQTYWAKVFF